MGDREVTKNREGVRLMYREGVCFTLVGRVPEIVEEGTLVVDFQVLE